MHLRLDPGVHRLRTRASTAEVVAHLARVGWSVRVVDLPPDADKAALLDACMRGISAPAWAGRNWDALVDVLRDLSWWVSGPRGRALVVAGAGRLGEGMDGEWATLCSVLVEAGDWWRASPTPLGVLVRGRPLA